MINPLLRQLPFIVNLMNSWTFEWLEVDSSQCWDEIVQIWFSTDFRSCLQSSGGRHSNEGGELVVEFADMVGWCAFADSE